MRLDWLIAGIGQDCSLCYHSENKDEKDRTMSH